MAMFWYHPLVFANERKDMMPPIPGTGKHRRRHPDEHYIKGDAPWTAAHKSTATRANRRARRAAKKDLRLPL